MKKTLIILAVILFSSSFAAGNEADPPALSARDTQNIIVAQDRQNQTLEDDSNQTPNVNQGNDKKVTVKDLKKAMTMKIEVVGNKSISTEDIKSVIKPYLKNTITAAERLLIEEEIQRLYTDKSYPSPDVKVESTGYSMHVTVIEE